MTVQKRLSSIDLKIVVLGAAFVGKTSIITRYCNNQFKETTEATVGAGFFTHTIEMNETEVTTMLWDTAGEERFKSVAPSFLRGANGLILAFDLSQKQTFDEMDKYLDLYLDNCSSEPSCPRPVMVFGNKADKEDFAVADRDINGWLEKSNIPLYFPVSAKTGEGIKSAMEKFIEFLMNSENTVQVTPIHIPLPLEKRSEKRGCCN
jgi:small GTP-binding protein